MGRYIDYPFLLAKYGKSTTKGGDDEVNSAYIVPAEVELDGYLGTHFTVPFSNNNITVKDLARDLTWYRMNLHRDKNAKSMYEDIMRRIKMLKDGQMIMQVDSGVSQLQTVGDAVWGETEDYHTSFGVDAPGDWEISSVWQSDLEDDRL